LDITPSSMKGVSVGAPAIAPKVACCSTQMLHCILATTLVATTAQGGGGHDQRTTLQGGDKIR